MSCSIACTIHNETVVVNLEEKTIEFVSSLSGTDEQIAAKINMISRGVLEKIDKHMIAESTAITIATDGKFSVFDFPSKELLASPVIKEALSAEELTLMRHASETYYREHGYRHFSIIYTIAN